MNDGVYLPGVFFFFIPKEDEFYQLLSITNSAEWRTLFPAKTYAKMTAKKPLFTRLVASGTITGFITLFSTLKVFTTPSAILL